MHKQLKSQKCKKITIKSNNWENLYELLGMSMPGQQRTLVENSKALLIKPGHFIKQVLFIQ